MLLHGFYDDQVWRLLLGMAWERYRQASEVQACGRRWGLSGGGAV